MEGQFWFNHVITHTFTTEVTGLIPLPVCWLLRGGGVVSIGWEVSPSRARLHLETKALPDYKLLVDIDGDSDKGRFHITRIPSTG